MIRICIHILDRKLRKAVLAAPTPLAFAAAFQALAAVMLPSPAGVVLQAAVFCCLLDARARLVESDRLERLFARYGPRERFLRLASASRCQRDAALAAAQRAGCRPQAAAYYYSRGYRWFHITPDAVVRNPLNALHPRFLVVTFVARGKR